MSVLTSLRIVPGILLSVMLMLVQVGGQKSAQLRALLPEARNAEGKTRDAWEGRVKFGALNYECQHAFVELMTEWSVMFTPEQLHDGQCRFL